MAWARGMKQEVAASYVGLSPSGFLRAVSVGMLPQPKWITRGRKIWLKDDLDDFLDRLFKRSSNVEEEAWMRSLDEDRSPLPVGASDKR